MTYRTKYPEVEKMLRKYSKAPELINEKKNKIKVKQDAQREYELLSSRSLSGLPKGSGVSDPTADFIEHIEYLRDSAKELSEEIQEWEKYVDDTERMLEEYLDEDEREIILLKYKSGQTHKQIIWKKKISKRELFRLLNSAYSKLGIIWHHLA